MKIVKLIIDELEDLMGINAVALVEEPAIEVDFQMFGKQLEEFETYNDYPKQAVSAANQGIKRNKELGNKCGTLVGKQRAQQLANGENVSLSTIKRMRSFLLRQKDNYDLAVKRKDYDACGYISYLLWGGPAALPWAEKKLRQAGELEASNNEIIKDELSAKFSDGKFFDDMDADTQELLIKSLEKRGLTHDTLTEDGWVEVDDEQFNNYLFAEIISEADKGSLQDSATYKVLYQYQGPKDSKNRDFCRKMLDLNKLFRLEDINNMSLEGANSEFSTYDIFAYKGSYNCRHRWVQKFFRKSKPLDEQKRATTTNKGPKEVIGGPRVQEASQRNPKSRTLGEILEGIPAGQFEFGKQLAEQQLLVTPIMIADKLIPRIDENGDRYYVFFPPEEIKKLSYKLMKSKLIDSINIEHDSNQMVEGVSLVETWLVDDPEIDKSKLFGFNVSRGSWMGVYKIDNTKIWNEYIKTGKVKGVSVEGYFADKIIMQNAITK